MKILSFTILFVFITINIFAQSFISPIDFVDNDNNRKMFISYIQRQVKDEYSAIGMDDPSTLRMMEKENLKAFKELTTVNNSTILKNVIKTYCDIGMCNYVTILMMYKEQDKANSKTLKW